MKLRLRRRPAARTEPPTVPIAVQSAAPWRPMAQSPDVGALIEVRSPTLGGWTLRARYQQQFRGTHWLLFIDLNEPPAETKWVDLRHLSGWRYV